MRAATRTQRSSMRNARPLVIGLALLLGLVGLASAPTAAAQVPTSISIRAERGAVAPGGAVVIAGHLFAPDVSTAGRPISLEAQAAGEVGFTPVDVAVTGASGGVRLVVRPESSTRYRLRYDGADDAGPGVSGVVLVRVRVPSR